MNPPLFLLAEPGRLHLARMSAVVALHAASAALARVAHRLAMPDSPPRAAVAPQLEFHAEAGAPEGALYVDGQLAGWLPGVSRL